MKKNSFLKCFSILAICSVTFVMVNGVATASSFSDQSNASVTLLTVQRIYHQMSSEEKAALNVIADEMKYNFATDLLFDILTNNYYYDSDHIYDLTGDEQLKVSDAQLINRFLHGTVQYAYEYSEMDGNADDKIDISDVYAYLAYAGDVLVGLIDDECITTHTTNSYVPETLYFNKYNATTGAYISSYSLTPLAVNNNNNQMITKDCPDIAMLNSDNAPFATIQHGNTRMLNANIIYQGVQPSDVYPAGIVKIVTKCGASFGINGLGSGFIIDDHTIATASHTIYDKTNNTTPNVNCRVRNDYILLFEEDGTPQSNLTITPVEYHVSVGFINEADGYDFGLITVEEDLSDYISLSLGLPFTDYLTSNAVLYNTGTPRFIGENNNIVNTYFLNGTANNPAKHTIVTTGGTVEPYIPNNLNPPPPFLFGTSCPLTSSGCPIYVPDNQAVLGIGTFGYGSIIPANNAGGVRIRSEMFRFFYNNPYVSY